MKLKYIPLLLFMALLSLSCSNDEDDALPVNEVEGLTMIQELSNDTHVVELYSKSGLFHTGYNAISLRIKNTATNTFEEHATVTWMPVMQMPTMNHSCPKSTPEKALGKNTVYEGYIIYQMTNLDGSGWSLTVDYSIDGVDYTVSDTIVVQQNELQNVSSFVGADEVKYVVAYVEPQTPIIGNNELVVGVYQMETMMSFPVVENYTLNLDPRMPGMGNHSSPNNTDLTYQMSDGMYHGNLSLTMTGYWVLNLKLLDETGQVLKGEDVTEENIQSSVYLELEF